MATIDFTQANGPLSAPFAGTKGGIHSVTSNQVVGASGAERGSILTGISHASNQGARVQLTSSTASRGAGILLRGSDSGSGYTGYLCFFGFTASWSISEYLNGVQVGADLNSGTGGAGGSDFLSGEFIRADMTGSNIVLQHKDVTFGASASDGTITTGTVGIYTYSDQAIDNLTTYGDGSAPANPNFSVCILI